MLANSFGSVNSGSSAFSGVLSRYSFHHFNARFVFTGEEPVARKKAGENPVLPARRAGRFHPLPVPARADLGETGGVDLADPGLRAAGGGQRLGAGRGAEVQPGGFGRAVPFGRGWVGLGLWGGGLGWNNHELRGFLRVPF